MPQARLSRLRTDRSKAGLLQKCQQWGHQVLPAARRTLKRWRENLEAIVPGFMAKHAADLRSFTSHQRRNMCNEVVQRFFTHIEKGKSSASPALKLSKHQGGAKIRHELRTSWPDLKLCDCTETCDCPTKVGMLEVICAHHAPALRRLGLQWDAWAYNGAVDGWGEHFGAQASCPHVTPARP